MLEGLILGVFLMTAEQAATPAPADAPTATTSSAAASSLPETAPSEVAPPSDATAAPAAAATTNTSPNANGHTDPDHVVRCHRGPPQLGSIMGGHRVCTTVAQDRERAQHDAEQLEQMQRRNEH